MRRSACQVGLAAPGYASLDSRGFLQQVQKLAEFAVCIKTTLQVVVQPTLGAGRVSERHPTTHNPHCICVLQYKEPFTSRTDSDSARERVCLGCRAALRPL